MKKSIIVITFLIVALFVPLSNIPNVNATQSTIASQVNQDTAWEITNNHPTSNATYYSGLYQTFNATSSGYIIAVVVSAERLSTSISGVLTARIEGVSGSYGTSGSPDGTVYATSLTVDVTSLGTNYGLVTFNFDGTYQVTANSKYCLTIELTDKEAGQGGRNWFQSKMSNPYGGDFGYFGLGAWSRDSQNQDMLFYVYASDTPLSASPSPTPSGLGSDDEYYWNGTAWVPVDNIVETTTDLVLPLLIPLIVILICAGLGAYFIGLWGFVLGLDVAVVLLYVALPTYMPLWGVLIVAVGNVIVLLMGRR